MNFASRQLVNHKARNLNKNTLNSSSSKRMAFFPSAPRFPPLKAEEFALLCSKASISCSQQSSRSKKRLTSLPRAQRPPLFDSVKQLSRRPSPQAYSMKSQDQIFAIKRKGSILGKACSSIEKSEKTPSASDYHLEVGQTKRSFNRTHTFQRGARNLLQFFQEKGKDSPGPAYNLEHFFKDNLKKEAERGKIRAKMIKRPQRKQILRRDGLSMANLNRQRAAKQEKGKNYRKNVGFTTTIRRSQKTNASIGPGSYRVFSEFSGSL